jgi:hypothetical protein
VPVRGPCEQRIDACFSAGVAITDTRSRGDPVGTGWIGAATPTMPSG